MKLNRGILLLLVAILGWFAVVRPQISVFSERSLEAKIRAEEEYTYKQRVDDVAFIKDKGASVQKTLAAQFLAMPKSSQIPEVLVMIESLAASSGVTLGTANLAAPTGNEVPVSISFTGNAASVNAFLDSLYNNVRTVIVKDQTLAADRTGTVSATMQLGLVFQGGAQ